MTTSVAHKGAQRKQLTIGNLPLVAFPRILQLVNIYLHPSWSGWSIGGQAFSLSFVYCVYYLLFLYIPSTVHLCNFMHMLEMGSLNMCNTYPHLHAEPCTCMSFRCPPKARAFFFVILCPAVPHAEGRAGVAWMMQFVHVSEVSNSTNQNAEDDRNMIWHILKHNMKHDIYIDL